jgi:MFS family permease
VTSDPSNQPTSRSTKKLFIIFAALYFIQGSGDPGLGLLAQPLRSMLKGWGKDAEDIAAFMFFLGFPWYIKPVFGLLTDFVPIKRYRRKSYIILGSLLFTAGFLAATFLPLVPASATMILLVLLLPSFGMAIKDVSTDAAMIEAGQPLGITGRLQSAQWAAMYGALLICGLAGGWISQHGLLRMGFVVSAFLGLVALYVGVFHIKEAPQPKYESGQLKRALKVLRKAATTRMVILISIFYFLLSFNPFSSDVLYVHMSERLEFSEQFIGVFYAVGSAGSILACLFYGLYSKEIPLRWLLHGSVLTTIVGGLLYIGMGSETSALVISAAVGFVYMVTSLTQLELASRYCPIAAAGTVFALLMSISNFSVAFSSVLGGRIYEAWKITRGPDEAFSLLVVMGAGITAIGWLLVFFFPKERDEHVPKLERSQ